MPQIPIKSKGAKTSLRIFMGFVSLPPLPPNVGWVMCMSNHGYVLEHYRDTRIREADSEDVKDSIVRLEAANCCGFPCKLVVFV